MQQQQIVKDNPSQDALSLLENAAHGNMFNDFCVNWSNFEPPYTEILGLSNAHFTLPDPMQPNPT
jgi:hypothetical protein